LESSDLVVAVDATAGAFQPLLINGAQPGGRGRVVLAVRVQYARPPAGVVGTVQQEVELFGYPKTLLSDRLCQASHRFRSRVDLGVAAYDSDWAKRRGI
jgi:hypothetical protein